MTTKPNKNLYGTTPEENDRDAPGLYPHGASSTEIPGTFHTDQAAIRNLGDGTLTKFGALAGSFWTTDNLDTVDSGKYFYPAGAVGSPDPLVGGLLYCDGSDNSRFQEVTTLNGESYDRQLNTDAAFTGVAWKPVPSTRKLLADAILDAVSEVSGLVFEKNPSTQGLNVRLTAENAGQSFIHGEVSIPRTPTSTVEVASAGIAADARVTLAPKNGIAWTLFGGNWSPTITVQPGVGFTITTNAINLDEYVGPDQSDEPVLYWEYIDTTGQVSLRGPRGIKGDTGNPATSFTQHPDIEDTHAAGEVGVWNASNTVYEFRQLTTADLSDFEQSPQEGEVVVRRGNAWVGEPLVQGLTQLDQMQDIEGTPRPGQMIQRSSTGQSFVYVDTPRSVNKLIGAGASANINDTNPHFTSADSYQKVQAITPVVPIYQQRAIGS